MRANGERGYLLNEEGGYRTERARATDLDRLPAIAVEHLECPHCQAVGGSEAIRMTERRRRRQLEHDRSVDLIVGSEATEDLIGGGSIALPKRLEGSEFLIELVEQEVLLGRWGRLFNCHGRRG